MEEGDVENLDKEIDGERRKPRVARHWALEIARRGHLRCNAPRMGWNEFWVSVGGSGSLITIRRELI